VFFARVIGKVVTSVSDDGLTGYPLLIVQPLAPDRKEKGAPVIALDRVGVGPGEEVFCETSKDAGLGLPKPLVAADAAIVARVDAVHIPKDPKEPKEPKEPREPKAKAK
jgi:microcompartment protein CcmK/EutM